MRQGWSEKHYKIAILSLLEIIFLFPKASAYSSLSRPDIALDSRCSILPSKKQIYILFLKILVSR